MAVLWSLIVFVALMILIKFYQIRKHKSDLTEIKNMPEYRQYLEMKEQLKNKHDFNVSDADSFLDKVKQDKFKKNVKVKNYDKNYSDIDGRETMRYKSSYEQEKLMNASQT